MPAAHNYPEYMDDPILRRVVELEKQVRGLQGRNPLSRATLNDAADVRRLTIGMLTGDGFGVEIFDAAGTSVFRADGDGLTAVLDEGGLTIDGGTVRAVDVAVDVDNWLNQSITATSTALASVTFVRPAWANAALVFATVVLQVSNNSGAGILTLARVAIGGVNQSEFQHSVENGTTKVLTAPGAASLTGVSTDITVEGKVALDAGSNSTNLGELSAQITWLR